MVAVAVSLLAPISLPAYWRYVIARFGWQIVAAILTAAVLLLASMLVTGRRRETGVMALGMLFSILMHMVVASLFGGYVLLEDMPMQGEMAEDLVAVSSAVPQWNESQLSEQVRSEFTAVNPSDTRELSVDRKETEEERAPDRSRVQARMEEVLTREPRQDRMQAVMASSGKARIEDELAGPSGVRADPVQAVDVRMAQAAVQEEARRASAAPRGLQDPDRRQAEAMPQDQRRPEASVAADVDRAPVRMEPQVDRAAPRVEREDEILAGGLQREDVDGLELRAAAMTAESTETPTETQRSMAAVKELEVAHQAAEIRDAAAPRRVAGELRSKPSVVSDMRLAEVAPGSEGRRVALDTTSAAKRDASGRAGEPAVMVDVSMQPVAGREGAPSRVSRKVSSASREVASARAGKGADLVAAPSGEVRAQVSLQGKAAGDRTLAGAAALSGASGATDAPGVEDRLMAAGRRADVGALAAVGRRAESAGRGAEQAEVRTGASPGRSSREVTMERTAAGGAEGLDVAADWSAGGPALEWASGKGTGGVAPGSDTTMGVASVQAVFAPAPEERRGTIRSAAGQGQADFVGFGSVASADAPVTGAQGATTATGRTARAGGWKDWHGADSKAGGIAMQSEGAVSFARQDVQDAFLGEASPRGSLAGGVGSETGSGFSGTRTAMGDDTPGSPASLATQERGGRVVLPAGAMRGVESSGSITREKGAAGVAAARGGAALKVEKAGAGLTQAVEGRGGGGLSGGRGSAGGMPVARAAEGRGVSLLSGEGMAVAHRGVSGGGTVADGSLDAAKADSRGHDVGTAFGVVRQEGGTGGGESVTVASAGGRASRAVGELRVEKAGGRMGGEASSRPDWLDVGSAGLSLSGGGTHGRLEGRAAEGAMSGSLALSGRGARGAVGARILITDELSSVPAKVVQKAIYTLRTPERRREIARELGGSDKTEQAVESALAWLALAQSEDGRWDVDGFRTLARCGGPGDRSDEDVALTGLCLLSYLGAGYTHVQGEHKETVRKALNWLIEGQKPDGDLQREGQMYGQAMATAALCESYSMTGDKRLLDPVEKAVGFIAKAQNPGAGWRYEPRKDSDTSVTGWQVLALKSAMIAGVRIQPEHFRWVEEWLDAVRRGREGGLYAYMPGQGATPTMTAEGWFCQLMMQEKTRMRGQGETIPYLMQHLPAWSSQENGVNLYFWYYSTLALYMSGAPEFTAWNKALVEALLEGQVQRGAAKGSWDPVCVLGARGGRIYMTATAALCLEVYYRYLPFYKQR